MWLWLGCRPAPVPQHVLRTFVVSLAAKRDSRIAVSELPKRIGVRIECFPIRVGNHAVEVPVEVMIDEGEGGWSPYFSLEEAKKLENARLALQRGDLAEAAKYGRLFELLPVSA